MLPDFLDVKRGLSEARSAAVSANLFGDPVLAKVRSYRQHEGSRFTIFRDDGTRATSEQKLLRSDLVTIDLTDVQARGEQAIYESVAAARQQIAIAGRKLVSETVGEESPKMDAGGRPFTAEMYLEILDTLFIGFDEEGNWVEPDFWQEFPNPRILARVESEKKRFESEPELRERLDALIARKKREWDDREANRKLVD